MKRVAMINKVRIFFQCKDGHLVYIIPLLSSELQAPSRKEATNT